MFKFQNLHIGKITALAAILTWLSLLFTDMIRLFGEVNRIPNDIVPEISWVLEIFFFILLYIYYNHAINRSGSHHFIHLIWKSASTGLAVLGLAFSIELFYWLLDGSRLSSDPLLRNFFYHVNYGLVSIFLISTAMVWKHLILYQKNKMIVQQWQTYEIILLMSMFFMFFNQNDLDSSFVFGMVFLIIFGIILSFNLKWIPYLTLKEKWKALLFLVIILVTEFYFFRLMISYNSSNFNLVSLTNNLFLYALFCFVFIYALFSFLVTLFNLPTSSVFEQKLVEAVNFQRLSRSIQPGQDEVQVLDILMDSSMSASYADAAWMEINKEPTVWEVIHQRFVSNQERKHLKELLLDSRPFSEYLSEGKISGGKDYVMGKINHEAYSSAIVFPLKINKEVIGNLFLLKEVRDGFDKEMIGIISTFVGQACISVENHRLLNEAIKNERYKEELEIAQRVQRSLLPSILHHNDCFEIKGFSEAADEVGGDYYETFQFDDHLYALIIGDVSGKGTSAAFNMAQMKGVFNSLVQLNFSPVNFLAKANSALGRCLEKNHFITATYYLIDTSSKKIHYARAGHCPTLYYDSKNGSRFMDVKGLGLGLLRSDQYQDYIEEKVLEYQKGDVMLLYTDGIIEARNEQGEEFGYDRLKQVLDDTHELNTGEIKAKVIQYLYEFVGTETLPDDDYTVVVVKFFK